MRPSKINKGDQFSDWTVLTLPNIYKGRSRTSVKCNCGTIKNVITNSLLTGRSQGCGCNKSSRLKKNSTSEIEKAAISRLYSSYKSGAKKRQFSFNLCKNIFTTLISQKCTYCNKLASNSFKIKGTYFKYNGIDRWNNKVGYERDNVLTCCKYCNFIKNTMDGNEFAEWLSNIHKNIRAPQHGIKLSKLPYYHERAVTISKGSHDAETKVGTVLINPETGAVISEGYNGFIRGAPDAMLPNTRPEKYDYMVHAETNLLCNAVRNGVQTNNAILYCTISPCVKCLRMLWQAGIKELYFKDPYRDFERCISMLDLEVTVNKIDLFYQIKVKPKG